MSGGCRLIPFTHLLKRPHRNRTKSDTYDLRESPIVKVVEILLCMGFSIGIYNSNVNLSKLAGANKSYIEQEILHFLSLPTKG